MPSGLFAALPPAAGAQSHPGAVVATDGDLLAFLRANVPVKLTRTHVDARALDDAALVTLQLSYAASPTTDAPSSSFYFQLPTDAAVYSLQITTSAPGVAPKTVRAKVY